MSKSEIAFAILGIIVFVGLAAAIFPPFPPLPNRPGYPRGRDEERDAD